MDSKNQNLELINVAIQKLMEERKLRKNSIDDDDQLLLSRLLSQVFFSCQTLGIFYNLVMLFLNLEFHQKKKKKKRFYITTKDCNIENSV